jgi:hypothetical protein
MTVLDMAQPKVSTDDHSPSKGLGRAQRKYKEKIERAQEMTRNVSPRHGRSRPLVMRRWSPNTALCLMLRCGCPRVLPECSGSCLSRAKGQELTVWAEKPLTKPDRDAICDDAHWYRIKFVSELKSYPQIREHLDEILEYFYPREDAVVIATPDRERGGRSR